MPAPFSTRPPRPIVATAADVADIARRVRRLRAAAEAEARQVLERVSASARRYCAALGTSHRDLGR